MKNLSFLMVTALVGLFVLEPVGKADDYTTFVNGGSVASSLDRLAVSLDQQAEEIDSLKSAMKTKVNTGSSGSTMKVSGRIHADYWGYPSHNAAAEALEGGNNPQNKLGFRRVRFGVAGDLIGNMRYKIEMDWANPHESAFKDVYLGWKDLPVLQTLLLGNQKRPYGLDHLNSSRFNVFQIGRAHV